MLRDADDDLTPSAETKAHRLLFGAVLLRPGELKPAAISAAYFFFLLSGYYVVRPLREEMGLTGGIRNLPWLFIGTMLTMIVASQVFAAVASRLPRRRFIPITYRFFALTLLVFFGAFQVLDEWAMIHAGRAFYIWISVFNLFVVSVFWAVMSDVYATGQSKRLFGLIGVGGTLGAIAGAAATGLLVGRIGAPALLLISIVLLECATRCASSLMSGAAACETAQAPREPGSNPFRGLALIGKSPYLQAICGYIFLQTIAQTLLYFEQMRVVDAFVEGREVRIVIFSRIDLLANVLTIVIQCFLTARILRGAGVGLTLALLPVFMLAGFVWMWLAPAPAMLASIIIIMAAWRALRYAVARPARETLFTVVEPDARYKSKNFIDTAVYRAGDVFGAGAYKSLAAVTGGLSLATIALCTVWIGVSVFLGRRSGQEGTKA